MLESITKIAILSIGWPILIIITVIVVKKGRSYQNKLQGTILGKLMAPTIVGWLFGLYSLGIVSTSYIFGIYWAYTVIPSFLTFLIATIFLVKNISELESEAVNFKELFENLDDLVKKRTVELENAHSKAIAHEKEIQALKDQFVFIAAHELKTPVTSISWGIELALDRGKEILDKETLEQLEIVKSSNQRLINLINDLLNIARIEAGTIKIELEEFDLVNVLDETIKEMKSTFVSKNIDVTFNAPEKIVVTSDPNRLKQVFINFLSNATKYNKDDGKISVLLKEDTNEIHLSIRDTGIGIKDADLPTLFTKFGRIKSDKTKDIEGTGLGLFLTKRIVELLGGEVKVQSEYGIGSTFIISLPKKVKQKDN